MPPFDGLRRHRRATLRCAYADGTEPFVVHHFGAKPWLEPTHDGVYSRLLRRLLNGDDVAIRVPERDLPLRLRRGPLAFAERKRVDLSRAAALRVARHADDGARPSTASPTPATSSAPSGLINSLRLHGHSEPIHLLDLRPEPEQRALLEPEVELVEAAGGDAALAARRPSPRSRAPPRRWC